MAEKSWLFYLILIIGIPAALFILYLALKIMIAFVEGVNGLACQGQLTPRS